MALRKMAAKAVKPSKKAARKSSSTDTRKPVRKVVAVANRKAVPKKRTEAATSQIGRASCRERVCYAV